MKFFFFIYMCGVLACLSLTATGQAPPALQFDQANVYVTGLRDSYPELATSSITQDQWLNILPIFTHAAFIKKLNQPVSGHYNWNDDTITFKPDFSFSPGETYHAVFAGEEFSNAAGIKDELYDDTKIEFSFSPVKEKVLPTSVASIYPESDLLPENTLRMYIHFSGPMMPGEAFDHIKLLRADGTAVDRAFLIVDQELWDLEHKRFTLLFDPGRIKRNLKSNLQLGTPLKEGEKYCLVIDSTWRDIHGNVLSGKFKKAFSVEQAERTRLSSKHWNVGLPLVGTRQALVIPFDRVMDHALISKYITINSLSSGKLTGEVSTVNDTTWKFTPDLPWASGEYSISISPLVEDVAGNNFNNPFDLDLSTDTRINSSEPVKIEFAIK